MSRRGVVLFVTMGVLWGVPYLLIKVAVRELTPVTLVFGRTAIGALVLLPIALARGQLRPVVQRWRPLLAYTVIELAIPWVLLSTAEQELPSSLTGLLIAAVPLVGAGLAWATGDRTTMGLRNLLGLLIGIAGVGALVGFDVHGADLGSVAMLGVVVVGYAVGPAILARSLHDVPGLGVVTASLALCALGYAPFAARSLPDAMPSGRVLLSVVALGLVCTAAAFVVFFHLIAEIGPVRATVITYLNPVVALLLGVTFLDEHIGVATVVGFGLILAGSVLAAAGRTAVAADGEEEDDGSALVTPVVAEP